MDDVLYPVSYCQRDGSMGEKEMSKKFKKGDLVILNDCPYDEQIPGELERYFKLKCLSQFVTDTMVCREHGSSGQWIKTDSMNDWTDSAWFYTPKCATNKCKRKIVIYDGDHWCAVDKRRVNKLRKERV
ncbi:MAG: hypothetical protein ACREBR_04805 [bacterium]